MNKIFNFIVFIVTISSCYSQNKSKVQEIQILTARNESSNINVSIIIDTIQYNSKSGIQFQISIENRDENPVVIKNITELSSFSLFDETNTNIMYPRVPRVLSHADGPVSYVEPFKVARAKINSKNMLDKRALKEIINIPARGSAEILLQIDSVLSKDAQKPYYRKDLIRVTPGTYHLTGRVLINDGKKTIIYRMNLLNPLKIRYK